MSPINTAYKGDFLSWTISLVEARTLVIADVYLDRLAFVAADLPLLERVVVLRTGADAGPEPSLAVGAPRGADGRARRRARRRRLLLDRRRPDHVHLGHHRPLQGRHQAERRRLLLGAQRRRVDGRAARRARPRTCADETYFSCLPLFHSNAQVLCAYPALLAGARVAYVERFSGTRFWQQAIDAGATTFNGIGAILYFLWNQPPSPTRPGPPGAHDLGRAGAEGHLPRVRGALRRAPHRGLRPHRDRRRHPDGPDPAAAPRQLRHRQPGLRGHDRRAGHRPAAAARHAGRDRGRHEDPEHRHARLLRHAGEDRRGLPQPEAPHRRPRAHGRRRLRLLHGPGEGLHPPPRRERLLDGGREAGLRPPGHQRGGRDRREGRRGRLLGGRDPRSSASPRAPPPTRSS